VPKNRHELGLDRGARNSEHVRERQDRGVRDGVLARRDETLGHRPAGPSGEERRLDRRLRPKRRERGARVVPEGRRGLAPPDGRAEQEPELGDVTGRELGEPGFFFPRSRLS